MTRTVLRAVVVAFLALPGAPSAFAGAVDDVRGRLEQWTDDFNAGRGDGICDLFSKEAISNYRGQPERNYDEICALLQDSIADPARDYRYQLDIREIIVEGDLAVVRLVWTLFIAPLNLTSIEPGIDVFRREADGKWRIIRYLAYEEGS
jgi:ketosteroid isomerase-like protein